jgi:CheY-like chemotaxis protein
MSAKILVVDDESDLEPLICQKFRRKIRQKEIEFFFAHDGLEALSQLKAQPDIDIVILCSTACFFPSHATGVDG